MSKAAYDYYTHDPLHRMLPTHSNFRVNENWFQYKQYFGNLIRSLDIEYIPTWDILCDRDQCLTRVGDAASDLTDFDDVHLTVAGANYVARAIAPFLFPSQGAPRVGAAALCRASETIGADASSPAQ